MEITRDEMRQIKADRIANIAKKLARTKSPRSAQRHVQAITQTAEALRVSVGLGTQARRAQPGPTGDDERA
jgi:hypothetical protein